MKRYLLLALMGIVAMFTFSSCSDNDEPNNPNEETTTSIVGAWELESVYDNTANEQLPLGIQHKEGEEEYYGFYKYFVFQDNGHCFLYSDAWLGADMEIYDYEWDYKIEGNKLIVGEWSDKYEDDWGGGAYGEMEYESSVFSVTKNTLTITISDYMSGNDDEKPHTITATFKRISMPHIPPYDPNYND